MRVYDGVDACKTFSPGLIVFGRRRCRLHLGRRRRHQHRLGIKLLRLSLLAGGRAKPEMAHTYFIFKFRANDDASPWKNQRRDGAFESLHNIRDVYGRGPSSPDVPLQVSPPSNTIIIYHTCCIHMASTERVFEANLRAAGASPLRFLVNLYK